MQTEIALSRVGRVSVVCQRGGGVGEESRSACLHKLIKEEDPLNQTAFHPDEYPELILAKRPGRMDTSCVCACVFVRAMPLARAQNVAIQNTQ